MSDSVIRAAIIGCGPFNETRGGCNSIAYAHALALRRTSGFQLVAAASRTPRNVADFCAEFPGTRGYADYRAMLAAERPDWVSVCAFPPDREAMCRAALDAGAKLLLVEKPFATTHQAMDAILAAAEATGARVFVNHQRRYGRWFDWFREKLQAQTCGAPRTLELYHGGPGFINFGPHLIDAALFALEPRRPVSVFAAVDWTDADDYQGVRTERSILADIRFDDGLVLTLHSGPGVGQGQPCLRAVCERGVVELHFGPIGGSRALGRIITLTGEATPPDFGAEHFHHDDTNPNLFYDRAVADILDCFKTGAPCRLDARHAVTGIAILLGAYASAKEGHPVKLTNTR